MTKHIFRKVDAAPCWVLLRTIPETNNVQIWSVYESEQEALFEAYRLMNSYRGNETAENLAVYTVEPSAFYGQLWQA